MSDAAGDEALARERQRALQVIAAAETAGYLTPINASEHRAFVEEARSADAIGRLVARLPEPSLLPTLHEPAPLPAGHTDAVPAPADTATTSVPKVVRMSAIFSSEERSGIWTVPELLELQSILGSIELDLREAFVANDWLDVHYTSFMGSIKLIVPPGVEVEAHNENVLGSFEHKRKRREQQTGAGFLLRLHGSNWLGSLEIVERALPTNESATQRVARWLTGGTSSDTEA